MSTIQTIIKQDIAKHKAAYAKMTKAGAGALAAMHRRVYEAREQALIDIKNGMDEMEAYRKSM